MAYGSDNLMPGVTLADIDQAAGVSPEDEGLWWDDEYGIWRDSEPDYCRYCGLMVPLDTETGMCGDCTQEIATLAKGRTA